MLWRALTTKRCILRAETMYHINNILSCLKRNQVLMTARWFLCIMTNLMMAIPRRFHRFQLVRFLFYSYVIPLILYKDNVSNLLYTLHCFKFQSENDVIAEIFNWFSWIHFCMEGHRQISVCLSMAICNQYTEGTYIKITSARYKMYICTNMNPKEHKFTIN